MSISTEITRLQNAKASITTSIENKGVTVPSATKLDGYSTLIDSIQTGITPTGTISITTNGTVDVTNYASADVSVSGGGGISVDDIAQDLAPSGAITLSNSVTEIAKYAFARKPLTSITGNGVTSILEDAFYYCPNLASISFPNLVSTSGSSNFRGCALTSVNFPELTTLGGTYVFTDNTNIETGVFPKLTSTNQSLRNSRFLTLDFGKKISIGNYWFTDCGRLATLILRSTELCPCTNTGGFSGTPFKSGGTGGTIYIPKVLYDHLGDNSAYDYQHASNWSTIYGYGTITWAKIEGSIYETQYADGTPIGA